MPMVVCPSCHKRLESDMYDADGNVTAPSHMETGLTRWCEAPDEPRSAPDPAGVEDDRGARGTDGQAATRD
jgi:hypothetical protein